MKKEIGPLSFNSTTGHLSGPSGAICLSPHLKAIAVQFWAIGDGGAVPFSAMRGALWPEGVLGPANPEQAFRRDLREVRIITRALAHGSGKMLDFRQNSAGDWLVRVRTVR
ncbi:hypothetical protein ACLEIY_17410 [Acetobacter tropicalis]|uniref:hypothetical protein n=1 Tax=Acetobacter tropicalis TaxID=104102 RepID=UPI003974CAC3